MLIGLQLSLGRSVCASACVFVCVQGEVMRCKHLGQYEYNMHVSLKGVCTCLHFKSRAQWLRVGPASPLSPGYYILYELCRALRICPCSHFQTSASVFRLEVLRCSRPVPPILQTHTADPSSDKIVKKKKKKAFLCVFVHPQATVSLSEIATCWNKRVCFSFSGPSGVNLSWRTSAAAILARIPSRISGSAPAAHFQMTQFIANGAKMTVKRSCDLSDRWYCFLSLYLFCFFLFRIFPSLKLFIFPFHSHFYEKLGSLPRPFLFPLLHRWNIRRPPLAFCRLEITFPYFPPLRHIWLVNWEYRAIWLAAHDKRMTPTTRLNFIIQFLPL